MFRTLSSCCCAAVLFSLSGAPGALAQNTPAGNLATVSIDDLMNVEVTGVSKKQQKLSRAGAAAFVISKEEIRRSGATNIPDLLRTAPGVNVAQINANSWAISIRGFNGRFANKVLVLVDGRTVYTPTTSGVFWDQIDVPLDDIERIEIIRGPGGTVWGANAVNGVINIVTRSAASTVGGLVRAGGGSGVSAAGLLRYGARAGAKGDYRLTANYANHNNRISSFGTPAADGWNSFHLGFRSDWTLSANDDLTVQGDLSDTAEGQTINVVLSDRLPLAPVFNDRIRSLSGNVLTRWNHTLKGGSDVSAQFYFDRYRRHYEGLVETLNTGDFDIQHHVTICARNDVVWGGGYRITSDGHTAGYGKSYLPPARTNNLYNGFVQDEIALGKSVWLTAGLKVEHNAYTGLEFSPGAQLVWQPAVRHAFWLSAAQAVRQTSREESDLRVDGRIQPLDNGGFGVITVFGDPSSQAEYVRDFGGGYRTQVNRNLSLDFSAFRSSYWQLATIAPQTPYFTFSPVPHLIIPLVFNKTGHARTWGGELSAVWTAARHWKISPSASVIRVENKDLSPLGGISETIADTPAFQAQIHSSVDFKKNFEWDTAFYHVGRLLDSGNGSVPAWNRVDTRLAWHAGEGLELSVAGQNLLTPHHAEYHDAWEIRRTLVSRTIGGWLTWRF